MKSVFVSSTFRDMHYERDMLRNTVLPQLNNLAKSHGDAVSFCDLRWGIDTSDQPEEEANKSVLSVCMNEIDRSFPYMIVLLGDRYGYVPGDAVIRSAVNKRGVKLDDYDVSVTQLEIEYGLYKNKKDYSNIIFYVRELEGTDIPADYLSESEDHKRRKDRLLEMIRQYKNAKIRTYSARWDGSRVSGLEGFAEMVVKDLAEEFGPQWREMEKLNYVEKTQRILEEYKKDVQGRILKEDFFQKRVKGMVKSDVILVHGQSYPAYCLSGNAGEGKTFGIRYCAELFRKSGYEVIEVFCGMTKLLSTVKGVLLYSTYQFEMIAKLPHRFPEIEKEDGLDESVTVDEILDYFNGIIQDYSKRMFKKKVVFVMDGISLLRADRYLENENFRPEFLSENVQFLYTSKEGGHELPAWGAEELPTLTENALGIFGKQLSDKVKKALYEKTKTPNPLGVYMTIARLTLMNATDYVESQNGLDGMEAINEQQLRILNSLPESLEELSAELIHSIAAFISSKELVRCFEYLAASREGLSLEVLEKIMRCEGKKLLPVQFVQAVNFFDDLFVLRDNGRYDFSHQCMRDGIKKGIEDERAYHDVILKCMDEELAEDDEFKLEERTWHLLRSSHLRDFSDFHVRDDLPFEMRQRVANDVRTWCVQTGGEALFSLLGERKVAKEQAREAYSVMSFLAKYVLPCFTQFQVDEELAMCLTASLRSFLDANQEAFTGEETGRLYLALAKKLPEFQYRTSFEEAFELAEAAEEKLSDPAEKAVARLLECRVSGVMDRAAIRQKSGKLHEGMDGMIAGLETDPANTRLCAGMYAQCGAFMEKMKNLKSNPEVLRLLLKARELMEKDLKGTKNDPDRNYEYVELLWSLGDAYFLSKDKQSVQNAQQCFKLALEESKRRRDRDKTVKAVEFYAKSYQRAAQFQYDKSNSYSFGDYMKRGEAATNLGYCTRSLADIKNKLKTQYSAYLHLLTWMDSMVMEASAEKSYASDYHVKEIEKIVGTLKEMGDLFPGQKFQIARAMYECANVATIVYGKEEWESIYNAYEDASDMAGECAQECATTEVTLLRVKCSQGIMNILNEIGGSKRMQYAAEEGEKAISFYRRFLERHDSADGRYLLADLLWKQGILLDAIGFGLKEKETLEKALGCFEEIQEIREGLKQMEAKNLATDLALAGYHINRIKATLKKF